MDLGGSFVHFQLFLELLLHQARIADVGHHASTSRCGHRQL